MKALLVRASVQLLQPQYGCVAVLFVQAMVGKNGKPHAVRTRISTRRTKRVSTIPGAHTLKHRRYACVRKPLSESISSIAVFLCCHYIGVYCVILLPLRTAWPGRERAALMRSVPRTACRGDR